MTQRFSNVKRIVLKLGTQVMMEPDGGLAFQRLTDIVRQCAELMEQGKEVLLVSSGSVGLGSQLLQPKHTPIGTIHLADKQACAAVGQNLLMDAYSGMFKRHGIIIGQVLVTASDLASRRRYLNLKQTFEKLLEFRVIPIINENDTVSTMELEESQQGQGFGDNDKLSALVASKLDADLLMILTNVDGIYTDNPLENPNATMLHSIDHWGQYEDIRANGQSAQGRGGMSTKLEAARIAAISGIDTVITSGFRPNAVMDALESTEEQPIGTLIRGNRNMSEKKRWIGIASGFSGVVVVNEGAKRALLKNRASLLAVGITEVKGEFLNGQVISIHDEDGNSIGRGISNFSESDLIKIIGHPSHEVPQVLHQEPIRADDSTEGIVVHRQNMVIFKEHYQ